MKQLVAKMAIVLVPSYAMAYLTGEMVWVMPTVVAFGILAASLGAGVSRFDDSEDDDGDDDDDDGQDAPSGEDG